MIYWLWLQAALGVGGKHTTKILSLFSTAKAVYEAGDKGRRASRIFSDKELKRLTETKLSVAKKIAEEMSVNGVKIISPDDELYPECLKNIANPPYVLFYKGNFPDFDNTPSLCIVGTRKVSDYGYKCAYSLAGRLTRGGFLIVSGGAVGSDTAAHVGAMAAGGKTVAILANGFNREYLKTNEKLREDILNGGGCLITEFSPDTSVNRTSFLVRNRLLSGLTSGTVVTEAPFKSGAVMTASYAIEQDREVFAIPSNPGVESYEGCNALIDEGAISVTGIEKIFSEYIYKFGDKISMEKAMERPLPAIKNVSENKNVEEKPKKITKKPPYKLKDSAEFLPKKSIEIRKNEKILPETLSKNAKIIYNQLNKQIFSCDDFVSEEINAMSVISALGELELYGLIESIPGGRYALK